MDTEVAPESRKPLAALNTIKGKKVGEKEAVTEKIDEASKPVLISFFLGIRSAINMAVNKPNTIPRVEKETAKLLRLAVNPNSRAKSGNKGWK